MRFQPGQLVIIQYPGCLASPCRLCGLAEIIEVTDYLSELKVYYKVQILNGTTEHGGYDTAVPFDVMTALEITK